MTTTYVVRTNLAPYNFLYIILETRRKGPAVSPLSIYPLPSIRAKTFNIMSSLRTTYFLHRLRMYLEPTKNSISTLTLPSQYRLNLPSSFLLPVLLRHFSGTEIEHCAIKHTNSLSLPATKRRRAFHFHY